MCPHCAGNGIQEWIRHGLCFPEASNPVDSEGCDLPIACPQNPPMDSEIVLPAEKQGNVGSHLRNTVPRMTQLERREISQDYLAFIPKDAGASVP